MITQLNIQGLAIIESLSIDFSDGFNVITGETGAGKSILIRALNFLMGAKTSSESVRKGWNQATVTGAFGVPKDHVALVLLGNLGIPVDESEKEVSILIRRQLTAKGRSQSWVNDVAVSSQLLRELGLSLVDIFGQHENQRLMEEVQHIEYVDNFLSDRNFKATVEGLSKECLAIVREIQSTVETFQSSQKNKDYLNFRSEEATNFAPSVEDYEKLFSFGKQADQMVHVRDTLAQALQSLGAEDSDESPSHAVWEAARLLGQLANSEKAAGILNVEWGRLQEQAEQTARALDDLNYEIGKLASQFDYDDDELEKAQSRLFGYQELFRKYGVRDTAALMQELDRVKVELSSLECCAEKIEQLLNRLGKRAGDLHSAAETLSSRRKKAGATIKNKVEKELHELAMPGSVFEVRFVPNRRTLPSLDLSLFDEKLSQVWQKTESILTGIGEGGAEYSQFLLASNPGEPILPLTRIASGGELSRIMLALKKALAADAETCVLVFDEIDTGISGRVADIVGKKMQDLAKSFQVICISHLPQVAVYADTHFLVRKSERAERTESSILKLSKEESAREIARLLSGAKVSTPSLANARVLIDRAKGKKRSVRDSHP